MISNIPEGSDAIYPKSMGLARIVGGGALRETDISMTK